MNQATKRTLEFGIAVLGTVSTVILLNQGSEYLRKKVDNDTRLAWYGAAGMVTSGILLYMLESKYSKQ